VALLLKTIVELKSLVFIVQCTDERMSTTEQLIL